MFKTDQGVENLNLSGNQFSMKQSKLLSSMIGSQKCILRSLDLSFNDFKDTGIAALCPGLKQNKSLVSLNIASNCFVNIGAQALIDALNQNVTLHRLNLTNNLLVQEMKDSLLEKVERNRNIKQDIEMPKIKKEA